ncbi:MAG: DNA polymerase III subunit gamma/tau [Terrimicrobiaceae bacterium]
MSYRVFARKYRPQTFAEVVGQDHITRTLQNAVSANRLAQAYLFVGPRGIGKTSTARILAKALNCVNGPTTTPCGVCDACKEIADGRSLDVIEIDGASNNGVENIRDLRDNAAYAPARGPFKIYLIDEVHMLSTGAFNALLKTLEEPPPHVKFIFATTEAQKLPATITSRCQRFDLRRIPTELIAKHLMFIADNEKITLDPAAAEAIARGAEGGLRDAESMLDQMVAFCGEKILAADVMDVFGFTSKETVTGLAQNLFARDAGGALGIIAEQSDAGKDLSRLTTDLIAHLRDLLVSVATGESSVVPQGKLLDLIDHFGEAETRMKWVADKKLQLDVAVIKALHLLDETSLTDVIETLTHLSSGELPPAPARPLPVVKLETRPVAAPAPQPARTPEKPEPAPEAKPAAVVQPEPSADPEDAEVSAATSWEKTSEAFAKDSFIRYGWLREGVFDRFESGRLHVRFPLSAKENSESIWMEQGLKDIETALTRALSTGVRLALEWDANLREQPEPESEAPPPREEREEPAPQPPAPSVDPMEEFKNDPLIKKALEIFKSTQQTHTA